MEQVQLIPTIAKDKISHHLSYPVGAEAISDALRATVQFPALRLQFYDGFERGLKWQYFEFLRVEYLNGATPIEEYPIYSLNGRPPQYRWEIVVQPVPRELRNRFRQYILESALPQIRTWLNERADLEQRGSEILGFFLERYTNYFEESDEFVTRRASHLEPLRS